MRPSRNTVHPQRSHRLAVLLASLLVVALLWAQSVGMWHRLVHFGSDPARLGMLQGNGADPTRAPAPSVKLFSNHHADTDCQLFDQLSHADAATASVAVAVGMGVVSQLQRASHGLAVARWHALFQARGPP